MRMTVLGGGSWGTALAHLMAEAGTPVTMLVREAEVAEAITDRHENPLYLPGLSLAPSIKAYTDPEKALAGADVCLLVTPCQFMRQALSAVADYVPARAVPVCASKGVELGTFKRMSEVVADVWPAHASRYAILSGPSFAREVTEGKPTAVALGCADAELGQGLREMLSSSVFRVYSTTDVAGVELGGAVKNIMAIAAGFCDGLGLGDSARASLITRGLYEMSRLGEAMGARQSTFMGLSGMGDLVLTCTGDLSRNRQVGLRLGKGERMGDITASMHMVAEGVKTAQAVHELALRIGLDLPVTSAVYRLINEQAQPEELVRELMSRALKEE